MNDYEKQSSTRIGTDEQREEKETITGGVEKTERKLCGSKKEKVAEEWREIIGFFGKYKISSLGRVVTKNKEIKKIIDCEGYYSLNLVFSNVYKIYRVHTLVAKAFIENPNNLPEIDHKDRDKLNNNINNLRWVSASANSLNSKIYSTNTTGFTGVYWHKKAKKWMAGITINYKTKHLGLFVNKADAINARKNALMEFWKTQQL